MVWVVPVWAAGDVEPVPFTEPSERMATKSNLKDGQPVYDFTTILISQVLTGDLNRKLLIPSSSEKLIWDWSMVPQVDLLWSRAYLMLNAVTSPLVPLVVMSPSILVSFPKESPASTKEELVLEFQPSVLSMVYPSVGRESLPLSLPSTTTISYWSTSWSAEEADVVVLDGVLELGDAVIKASAVEGANEVVEEVVGVVLGAVGVAGLVLVVVTAALVGVEGLLVVAVVTRLAVVVAVTGVVVG